MSCSTTDRLVRWVERTHARAAVDDHFSKHVAAQVDGPVQPFRDRLGDRRLAGRLDPGDQDDRHAHLSFAVSPA
jgi:hypothetical protein